MSDRPAFPPADCRTCGRCCFDHRASYIRVFEVDHDRMGPHARSLTREADGVRVMRFDDGRCGALVVDPALETYSCGIYEDRPDACRALARGSGACKEAWTDKAGAAHVALDRLRRS